MFGTPSGVVLSPQDPSLLGRAATDLPIREGYVLSGLDPASIAPTSPLPQLRGTVEAIALAEQATGDMHTVDHAKALANRGLDGDRYAAKAGTFTPANDTARGYDLTLIEAEVLDSLTLPDGGTPRLRRGATQHRHPRNRPQCPGRATLPGGQRRVPRPAALRAVLTPRAPHHQGRAPRTDPPRRPTRRCSQRRRDQPPATSSRPSTRGHQHPEPNTLMARVAPFASCVLPRMRRRGRGDSAEDLRCAERPRLGPEILTAE